MGIGKCHGNAKAKGDAQDGLWHGKEPLEVGVGGCHKDSDVGVLTGQLI